MFEKIMNWLTEDLFGFGTVVLAVVLCAILFGVLCLIYLALGLI